jgi:putative sugar O-methyltransferase
MNEDTSQLIQDDIALLDCMIEDQKNVSSFYQPEEETAGIMEIFFQEIRRQSLNQTMFEGTRSFNAISACNFSPSRGQIYTLGNLHQTGEIDDYEYEVLLKAAEISRKKPKLKILPYEISENDLNETAYRIADTYGCLNGARPLKELSMSLSGRPEYYFTIEGRNYSFVFLYHYMRYAFCCKHIDFDKIDNFIELGSGSGRIVEIVRKLHPYIKFYLLDLPPQLYLCHQFLKSIFGDSLVPYQQTRKASFNQIDAKGGIAVLPVSRIETIQPEGNTISWNQMVYSTMNPPVVKHYLDYIRKMANSIYIIEPMTKEGRPSFEIYNQALSNDYKNIGRSRSLKPLGYMESHWGKAEDTVWIKK